MFAFAVFASAALACAVTDGDSLRCGRERVRLLGIDAPELHRCPRDRRCAPGNGGASKAALARAVGARKVNLQRVGKDRYGRTIAIVHVGRVNLSCAQLAAGQAIYKPQWDNGRRIARACPKVAR